MARASTKDPLDKFRFKVYTIGSGSDQGPDIKKTGFQSCQMPKRNTGKIIYREGIDNDISFNSAGLSTMEDITLSKGITSADSDFYNWICRIHNPSAKKGEPGFISANSTIPKAKKNYRKELIIEVLNKKGEVVRCWRLYNVFPVNFTPGSDLDSSADDGKSIESVTLCYDDFEEVAPSDTSKNSKSPTF